MLTQLRFLFKRYKLGSTTNKEEKKGSYSDFVTDSYAES